VAGVRAYPLGQELVLYFPNGQQAFSINRSARAIWEMCDGRHSLLEIGQILGQELELPAQALLPDITDAIKRLVELGLLELE